MATNISRVSRFVRKFPMIDYGKPVRIEMGCGDNKHRHPERKEGWYGMDIVDYGQEIIWDMEENLPFPDKSVDEIYSSHTFEHISNLVGLMNECWRILKDEGKLYIIVPHKDNEKAYIPSHVNHFDKFSWMFFEYRGVETDYFVKPWIIEEIIVNERPDIHVKMKPKREEE